MRILAFFLLSALAANAVESNRIELFLQLVREVGCQMDNATAGQVLPANGFTRDEVSEIESVLAENGMIDTSKMGVFALTQAACNG